MNRKHLLIYLGLPRDGSVSNKRIAFEIEKRTEKRVPKTRKNRQAFIQGFYLKYVLNSNIVPLPSKPAAPKAREPGGDKVKRFYRSADWKRARYDALRASNGCCELCGVGKAQGAVLNVDHIKPLRKHWDLRLEATNLQVLCAQCNCGKGNRHDDDWRDDGGSDLDEQFRRQMREEA